MKINILKLFVLSSLLFLGIRHSFAAQAVIVANNNTSLTASPITSQLNAVLYEVSVTSTGSTNAKPSTMTFTATTNPSLETGSISLYTYTSATFPGVGSLTPLATITNPTANLAFNFSAQTITTNGNPQYFFLVENFSRPTTAGNIGFECTNINNGANLGTNSTYPATPVTSDWVAAISVTYTAYNTPGSNGLSANPISTTQSSPAIYGFNLTGGAALGGATATAINQLTFTDGGTIGGANSNFFANIALYSSTTSNFTGAGNSGSALVVSVPSDGTTAVTFTGLNLVVSPGTTTFYFIVVTPSFTVSSTSDYQLNYTGNSGTMGITAGTTTNGYDYTITPPTYTIVNNNSNIQAATTPYYYNSTGDVLESIGVSSTSVGVVLNSFTLATYIAGANSAPYTNYFSNLQLFSSPTANYATALATGGTAGLTSVTFTNTGTTTNPVITLGNSQALGTTPLYYFLVADFTAGDNLFSNTTTATTFQFELTAGNATYSSSNAAATNTFNVNSNKYNLLSPIAFGNSTSNNTAGVSLNTTQTQVSLIGFSLTAAAGASPETVNTISFNANIVPGSNEINAFFSNVTLYYNTTDNPATANAVPPGSPAYNVSSLNGKILTISGLSLNVTATTVYYYVKADFTAPTNFSSTFQLSATGCTTTTPLTCTAGIPVAGTLYNISPSVILGAATTTGLAANPITSSQNGNTLALFSFSVYTGPANTFTTFNLNSVQPSGQYLGTNFTGYALYVNTTQNKLAGATKVNGAMFSSIAASNTLTISSLSQTIPAGKTYYYFIEAVFNTPPPVATTYQLNLTSVATASTTYTTGGPVNGIFYTLAGPLGVYYWQGDSGGFANWEVWESAGNWLNANTNTTGNGYPNASANNDIAVFSATYANTYIIKVKSSKTVSQLILAINNKFPYAIELANNISFTVSAGLVLGDPGQVNTIPPPANPYLSQLQLLDQGGSSSPYYINGTSYIYNDGSLAIGAPTTFSSGSILNLYGTAADPAFFGMFGGAVTATNCTWNLSGNGSDIYLDNEAGSILNATNSTVNFSGFSSQLGSYGTVNFTNSTVNSYSISDNGYLTGMSCNDGTFNIIGSTINLGTASNNGNYNGLKCDGGTMTVSGSSVVNLKGPSSFLYCDYKKDTISTKPTVYTPQAIFNINASTINIGTLGGGDGSGGNLTNTDAGYFNLNSGSVVNINGANAKIINTSSANFLGVTGYGVFQAASTSFMNPTSTSALIDNDNANNYFTLLSDANGSATIGQLGVGAKITGQYNVQRYISAASRNYRLLSSATNSTSYLPGSAGTANHVNVSLVAQSATIPTSPVVTYPGAFVGGPAGTGAGFTGTSIGPTMYLYQESIVPSLTNYNSSFYSGKNVGITKLGTNSPYYLTTSSTANAAGGTGAIAADNAANIIVGPGNGYFLYYIHDNTSTNTEGPLNTTSTTASGYVNQGTIPFVLWGSNGSLTSSLTNNGVSPIVNPHAFAGLTMVGNPYPSSIDLQQLYKDNLGGSAVFLSGAIEYFSELNPSNAQFVTYGYDGANVYNTGGSASRYVASGQGFYVTVQNANQGLTFYEDEKTTSAPSNVTESIPVINPDIVNDVNTVNSKIADAVLSGGSNLTSNNALPSSITSTVTDVRMAALSIKNNSGGSTANLLVNAYLPTVRRIMVGSNVSSVKTTASNLPAPKNTPPPSSGSVSPAVAVAGLHLKLVQDSLNYDECGLYFSEKFADTYNKRDATDMDGVGGQVYLSSYTSDRVRTSVNLLGDYKGGKRVPLFVKFSGNGIFQLQMEDIANFNTNNYSVFLIDNLKKDSLDLTLYKSYNFNYATGTPGDSTRFVLAIEHKPVPHYALLAFAGQKVTQGVQLNWKTLNEANTTSFVLQKLNSGNTYTFLDSLHSDSAGAYAYVDQHPLLGDNTYRLQQTDALGNITYSAPVTIGYNSTLPNGGLTIYPNPAKSTITVTLSTSSIASQIATADIYNTSGTLISHRVVTSNSFNHDISNYQLGVYIIELRNSNGILVGKSKFVKVQ